MPNWGAVRPEHVHAAVAESDRLGRQEFLDRYHFRPARDYLLVLGDRYYDSKAVLGVAYGYASGRPLTWQEFTGGDGGAARVLRGLGFQVDGPEDGDRTAPARSGTYRESDGASVSFPEAQTLWMAAGRERLVATARVYHAVTTYKELAEEVQADTGVRTKMLMMNWIGGVLGLVAEGCASRGERSESRAKPRSRVSRSSNVTRSNNTGFALRSITMGARIGYKPSACFSIRVWSMDGVM